MPLIFAFAAAACLAVFVWGFHLRTADRELPRGLGVTVAKAKRQGFGPLGGLVEALGAPFGPALLRLISPAARGKVRRRIERAGRPGGMRLEDYARNRAGNMVLYGGAGVLGLLIGHPFIALLLVAVGLFQTDIVLWNVSRERQAEIQKALPDFLDVLAVTVSAGLGFRQALARVAESMPGALSAEMQMTLRQMELGRSLREAFQELRQRNDSESLSGFVTAVLQAEELGAPLAQALTEIGVDMRREASQHARRRAQRVDPQVTMITTFLMVPGMMLLLVGMLWFGSAGSAVTRVFH
ncbi:DUF5936 domain-containing protein [Actinomadura scrupuli]|uniref:DUF5936 domain-containing protein n=1 Tax=Actinomadura scrupuli TaxID=559629 RepID=UPI003D95AB67